MADNVAITPGTGATVAADDVGGVLYQRIKVTWGPDATANDADVATGKPMPVQLRSSTGLIPLGEPTDAKSTATDTTSASLVSIAKQISASVQSLDGKTVTGNGEYETVAASQTNQAIGATGATGDFLEGLICVVSTPATCQVQIKDGAGSAITVLPNNVGSGVGTYPVPLGLTSGAGAWQVTTGAGVSVIAVGNFT